MQLLRKISTRTVFGGKGEVLELVMADKTKPHTLYRVGGEATAILVGHGQDETMRPWIALLGRFRAVNVKTGEIFTSMKCFLPEFLSQGIGAGLGSEPGEKTVTFLFDITAQFDEASATSYVYGAAECLPPEEGDSLERLFGNAPALPSPDAGPPRLAGKKAKE